MQITLHPNLHFAVLLIEFGAELTLTGLKSAWKWHQSAHANDLRLKRLLNNRRYFFNETVGGRRFLRLTPEARRMANGGRDLQAHWDHQWDGVWRMVLFDIPESERNTRERLRRSLKQLGFGCLQNSTWVTPFPIDSLSFPRKSRQANAKKLCLFESRPCGGETNPQIVKAAWNFPAIQQLYHLHRDILKHPPKKDAEFAEWEDWMARECSAWRDAVQADPLLPRALWPKGYKGEQYLLERRRTLQRIFLK